MASAAHWGRRRPQFLIFFSFFISCGGYWDVHYWASERYVFGTHTLKTPIRALYLCFVSLFVLVSCQLHLFMRFVSFCCCYCFSFFFCETPAQRLPRKFTARGFYSISSLSRSISMPIFDVVCRCRCLFRLLALASTTRTNELKPKQTAIAGGSTKCVCVCARDASDRPTDRANVSCCCCCLFDWQSQFLFCFGTEMPVA